VAYGQSLALRSGMLLDADVWIDRRRLIEWIFDPLLSVAGRV
jgi:membrane fusion protein